MFQSGEFPVWYVQAGSLDATGKFAVASQGSAVLVAVTKTGEKPPRKLLLTAQHVLRSGADQRSGPYHQAIRAWPPNVGYNEATALPVSVFADLTPDAASPLVDPEDFAFLGLPPEASGSLPTRLLDDASCKHGLSALNIIGYISGDDIIKNHVCRVEPARHPDWRYVSSDAVRAISILGPGAGKPAGGVSGGGVFCGERFAGVYRGEFLGTGEHLFIPITRLREWCELRGYEMAQLVERLAEVINGSMTPEQLNHLVRLKLGADMYRDFVPTGLEFQESVSRLLTALSSRDMAANLVDALLASQAGETDTQNTLREIREALPQQASTAPVQVAALRQSLEEVTGQLATPTIRKLVKDSEDVLTRLADAIEVLRVYKTLHDCLHRLQFNLRNFSDAVRALAKDPAAAAGMSQPLTYVQFQAVDIEAAIAALPPIPSSMQQIELDWLNRLNEVATLAQAALDNGDGTAGRQSLQKLRSLLRTEPSRIDALLRSTADGLDLARLRELFARTSSNSGFETGVLTSFRQGETASEQVLRQVKAFINQHSQWQSIDRSLWEADEFTKTLTDDPADFDALWAGVKSDLSVLLITEPSSAWAQKLAAARDQVDARRKTEEWPKVTDIFGRFRDQATAQFFIVDTDLKKLAGQVAALGVPLRQLLSHL